MIVAAQELDAAITDLCGSEVAAEFSNGGLG
jgi:hypothetical protein